jgi:putative chitinase
MPLANPKAFFDRVRDVDLLGPTLTPDEVAGCNAILTACARWPLAFIAYALATAYHETAGTMQPIKERGGDEYLRRNYDVTGRDPDRARRHGNIQPGDGVKFCGRGFVQLTWHANYVKAGARLGVDLVGQPDLAMNLAVAAGVLEAGMREGWFTGKSLSSCLPTDRPAKRSAFAAARAIINGTDRADDIAGHAMDFQEALMAGGWTS